MMMMTIYTIIGPTIHCTIFWPIIIIIIIIIIKQENNKWRIVKD